MWLVESRDLQDAQPRGAAVSPGDQSRMRSVPLCADSLPPFCSQGSRGDPGDAGPRGESGQPGPKVCPLFTLQDGTGSLTKSSSNLPAQPPWCGRTSGAEEQPPPTSPIFSPLGVARPPKVGPAHEAPPHPPPVQASCLSLHIFPRTCPDWPPVSPRETLAGLDSAIPAPEEHL